MDKETPTEREWITASEAADILGVHPRTVVRRAENGMIRVTKNPGSTGAWMINRADVDVLKSGGKS